MKLGHELDGTVGGDGIAFDARDQWGTMLELRPVAMPRADGVVSRPSARRLRSGRGSSTENRPTLRVVPESTRGMRTDPRREFEQLLAAGQLELAAERFISAVLTAGLAATFANWASEVDASQTQETADAARLTRREREVAARIAAGQTNRAIADELFIAQSTVERHVANMLNKLGFSSRTQIAAWAVKVGLAGA